MFTNNEKQFIPSFIFSSLVLAIIAPYLPILLRELGYSPVWIGILLGIHSGAGIAGPILFGHLADKTRNYRPVLIITCLLPALMIFPLIRWVHIIISAIFISFLAFGQRSTVPLLDAITTIQIGKTGNYGRIRVWGSITFVLATLFFQWTPFIKPNSAGNISIWVFIAAIISVIPILALPGTVLRPSAEHHTEIEAETEKKPLAISIYAISGFSIIFLCNFSMTSVYTYFPLYLTGTLQWDAVGLMFALAAVSEIPFMFISGALIRRFGSLPLLALGAAGIALRLLIWVFLPFRPFILASQMLHSLCFGILHPAAIHFISEIFPARKRGFGMSLYTALGMGLPSLVGNMVGGAVVEAVGYPFLFTLYAAIAGFAILIVVGVRLQQGPKYNEKQG
jgi:PPP family 3-phenylpropionic acid transporter